MIQKMVYYFLDVKGGSIPLIVYKCKSCGGEMSIDSSGALYCEFCGSKANFSDQDLQGYREFRSQMLNYLRSLHDTSKDDVVMEMIWGRAEEIHFTTDEGADICIRYLYQATDGPATMYVTRNAVLYRFPKFYAKKAEEMLNGLNLLAYPEADIKGLQRCFPVITGNFRLSDGGVLLAFRREETVFPLSMYGALPVHHVAWIVSRMENIACVLEYSEMVHHGISIDSLFINPVTHEAVLYGGWWNAKQGNRFSALLPNTDLVDLRATAKKMLGVNPGRLPKEFEAFLAEKPNRNAYDDFTVWDEVIEKGFGGRQFHKMEANENIKV